MSKKIAILIFLPWTAGWLATNTRIFFSFESKCAAMFTVLKGFRYKLARNRREICWNERDGMGDGVKARERERYIYRE